MCPLKLLSSLAFRTAIKETASESEGGDNTKTVASRTRLLLGMDPYIENTMERNSGNSMLHQTHKEAKLRANDSSSDEKDYVAVGL